jgi:SAM-dependent methyltransferase
MQSGEVAMSTILAEQVSVDLRDTGKENELHFWREFCQSERFINNFCLATPNPEIDVEVEIFLKGLACEMSKTGRTLSILDVGSGPVSMLSRSFVGQQVDLKAADPLANEYDAFWDAPYKNELARPVACDGEKLSEKFGSYVFDVVHIRNALDHVIHPITVIEQMIKVAKIRGYLIIHGFENEADAESWMGFHQWNLSYAKDDLIIRGKNDVRYSLAEHFEDRLRVLRSWACIRRILVTDRVWCGVIAQII